MATRPVSKVGVGGVRPCMCVRPFSCILLCPLAHAYTPPATHGVTSPVSPSLPFPPRGPPVFGGSAPEVLAQQSVDEKVDMWALGVVMWVLLTGSHPFGANSDLSEAEVARRVAEVEPDLKVRERENGMRGRQREKGEICCGVLGHILLF